MNTESVHQRTGRVGRPFKLNYFLSYLLEALQLRDGVALFGRRRLRD